MPNRFRSVYATASVTALASLLMAGAAAAQTAPAQTNPPQTDQSQSGQTSSGQSTTDKGTTTVTVTGAKAQNRIDRQVYDNTKNIDSSTGTAADALNKVPSVNVDANGNVTLRGNSNVQVYVDGKPSAMMQGDNRAGALQAMSSSDIQSVEVMTNPGAQFSSEGTGGIINLVMKKNRRPGGFGSAVVNVGSTGGYNGNLSGSYTAGKLTVSGGMNYRSDKRNGRGGDLLEPLDSSGKPIAITQNNSRGTGDFNGFSTNGEVDYNLSDKDTLSAQANYSSRDLDIKYTSVSDSYSPAMAPTIAYTGVSRTKGPHEDYGTDFNWSHTGDKPGETLKADLRIARSDGSNDTDNTYSYTLPTTKVTSDTKHSSNDDTNAVLSVDYNTPVGEDQLSTGLQITHDSYEGISNSTGNGTISNALLSSDFAYDQTISAAYITYQKPFGDKWVVLGGVRAEALDLKTNQINTATTSHINYTKLSPSFFATYLLSPTAKLRFSYSHRLQRPNPQSLNPSTLYVDSQNLSTGNPNLKPQETDSFELGYEVTKPTFNYSIRGFYRKNDNVITQVSNVITTGTPPTTVQVTTQENFGSGSAGGVDFNISGQVTKALTLGINGTLAANELRTPNIVGTQRDTSLSGRFMVGYTFTPLDSL